MTAEPPLSVLTSWLLAGLAVTLVLYVATVLALMIAGRRASARALAGFVPDCVVLVRRLIGHPHVSRRSKLVLVLLVAYLAVPVDLVPDFVPVAGQLDDAIVVALALRMVLRSVGRDELRALWPGPESSWAVVARLAAQ